MPKKTNPLLALLDVSPMTGPEMKALLAELTDLLDKINPEAEVHVTQNDLAAVLGTSQSRLSAWMRSEEVPHRVALSMRLIMDRARQAQVDPALRFDLGLFASLGSLAVHVDEALSPDGHRFDALAMQGITAQPNVQQFVGALQAQGLVPEKRTKK